MKYRLVLVLLLTFFGSLDAAVLVAKGSRDIVYMDSREGLHSQYVLGSVGKQMSAAALLKALYDTSQGSVEEQIAAVKIALQQPLIHFIISRGLIPLLSFI